MSKFSVQLTNSAVDDINAIHDKQRIISDIKGLCVNPLPSGINVKKLKGFNPPLYRLRSGDYRVLYRIDGASVIIMRVIDRKELERAIKRIKKIK